MLLEKLVDFLLEIRKVDKDLFSIRILLGGGFPPAGSIGIKD